LRKGGVVRESAGEGVLNVRLGHQMGVVFSAVAVVAAQTVRNGVCRGGGGGGRWGKWIGPEYLGDAEGGEGVVQEAGRFRV